jgi:YHS domain-containing protein
VSLPEEHRQDNNVVTDENNKSNNLSIIDPVCGMQVTSNPDKSLVHDGKSYSFCGNSCMDKFKLNPEAYVSISPSSTATIKPHSCCSTDDTKSSTDKPYVDPVCGMQTSADPDKSLSHLGVTYHFCSQHCITKFKAQPELYLHPDKVTKTPQTVVKKDAIYTCPMHPEIQQVGPGLCPKCGMALEPMDASVTEDTTELRDMTRRFGSVWC